MSNFICLNGAEIVSIEGTKGLIVVSMTTKKEYNLWDTNFDLEKVSIDLCYAMKRKEVCLIEMIDKESDDTKHVHGDLRIEQNRDTEAECKGCYRTTLSRCLDKDGYCSNCS